jgi:hypothetical protein
VLREGTLGTGVLVFVMGMGIFVFGMGVSVFGFGTSVLVLWIETGSSLDGSDAELHPASIANTRIMLIAIKE